MWLDETEVFQRSIFNATNLSELIWSALQLDLERLEKGADDNAENTNIFSNSFKRIVRLYCLFINYN